MSRVFESTAVVPAVFCNARRCVGSLASSIHIVHELLPSGFVRQPVVCMSAALRYPPGRMSTQSSRGTRTSRAKSAAHVDIETARLIETGMAPDQARTAARRAFGNVTRAQERFYGARPPAVDRSSPTRTSAARSATSATTPVAALVAVVFARRRHRRDDGHPHGPRRPLPQGAAALCRSAAALAGAGRHTESDRPCRSVTTCPPPCTARLARDARRSTIAAAALPPLATAPCEWAIAPSAIQVEGR